MPIVNLFDVIVPKGRIRREFSEQAQEELITSILSKGLLHPPVVTSDNILLAGERRLRALSAIAERGLDHECNHKTLRPGLIMVTLIRDLSPADRLEAELEENTIRQDVSWQEKAQAVEALHHLRSLQKVETTAPGLEPPPQTIIETAAELHRKPPSEVSPAEKSDTRADLLVAAWLTSSPDDREVANAKTRSEALKLIEIRLEDEKRVALSKRFLASRPAAGNILKQGDCINLLAETPANLYDVIIADPPWGVDADQWTNGLAQRTHSYADDLALSDRINEAIAVEGFRVCKPKAHLYLFCAFRRFEALAHVLRSVGWDVWPRPLIWFKGISTAPDSEHGPAYAYECIIFANKGHKRVLSVRPDVIVCFKGARDERAAVKPPGVYFDLLRRSVLPGDEVLDPCCGAGPIFPAANALEVRATGYDIADDAIGLASQRLTESYVHFEPEITTRSTHSRGGVRVKKGA